MRKRLLILIIPILAGCSRQSRTVEAESSKAAPPTVVEIARAESRRLDKAILVTGSLGADESVTVGPEVAGRILSIRFDFGQTVRKGDIIAELDKTEYLIQVERSRAALNQALARLGLKPGQENAPPQTTASIRQAQALLEDTRFKFESAQKLVKTGDISQERYNEIEKAYHARQAALDATQDELRTMWMSMESLRAETKLAEKRLADTVVHAPFDGSVSQKHVSPGQFVKENSPIVTLVKTHPLRLRVDIPESAAGDVRIGTALSFTTDAAPGAQFQAVVRELNPSLDARTRTLAAEARLTGSDTRLRPGMFVQVRLVTDHAADSVMAPKQALYSVAGLTKLFVIRDGRAVERRILPGRESDGWVEVPADMVHPGDAVAVTNVPMLVDGAAVRVQ